MWHFGEGSDQYDYKPMKLLEHVQKHSVTANTVLPITYSAGLIQHIIATNQHLPEIAPTSMYEYVYAGNGTFVRARREGLVAIAQKSGFANYNYPKSPRPSQAAHLKLAT